MPNRSLSSPSTLTRNDWLMLGDLAKARADEIIQDGGSASVWLGLLAKLDRAAAGEFVAVDALTSPEAIRAAFLTARSGDSEADLRTQLAAALDVPSHEVGSTRS